MFAPLVENLFRNERFSAALLACIMHKLGCYWDLLIGSLKGIEKLIIAVEPRAEKGIGRDKSLDDGIEVSSLRDRKWLMA